MKSLLKITAYGQFAEPLFLNADFVEKTQNCSACGKVESLHRGCDALDRANNCSRAIENRSRPNNRSGRNAGNGMEASKIQMRKSTKSAQHPKKMEAMNDGFGPLPH